MKPSDGDPFLEPDGRPAAPRPRAMGVVAPRQPAAAAALPEPAPDVTAPEATASEPAARRTRVPKRAPAPRRSTAPGAATDVAMATGPGAVAPVLAADAAETEILAGNLAAAGRLLDEALASSGSSATQTRLAIHRARLDILAGRIASGRAAAAAGVTAAEGTDDNATAAAWLAVLGMAELLAGDPSVAAVHFTTVRDASLERGVREPGAIRVDADLVEALVSAGRLDEAQAALDGFRVRGESARTPWVIAATARSEALVRTARGEPEAALTALRAAAATIESLPLPLERGRCLLAWGVALRSAGRLNAARAALTTARETFAHLPSPPWEARTVAEMAQLRRRPAAPS